VTIEKLERNLTKRWGNICYLKDQVQDLLDKIKSEEIWADIYGAILYYKTHDWEEKPTFVDFLKSTLTKEAFSFWSRHKDMFE